MAELLNQILSLPKAEQLKIMAAMIEHLRTEEHDVPDWQIDLAGDALAEIEKEPDILVSNEEFWATIDSKIESLEKKGNG